MPSAAQRCCGDALNLIFAFSASLADLALVGQVCQAWRAALLSAPSGGASVRVTAATLERLVESPLGRLVSTLSQWEPVTVTQLRRLSHLRALTQLDVEVDDADAPALDEAAAHGGLFPDGLLALFLRTPPQPQTSREESAWAPASPRLLAALPSLSRLRTLRFESGELGEHTDLTPLLRLPELTSLRIQTVKTEEQCRVLQQLPLRELDATDHFWDRRLLPVLFAPPHRLQLEVLHLSSSFLDAASLEAMASCKETLLSMDPWWIFPADWRLLGAFTRLRTLAVMCDGEFDRPPSAEHSADLRAALAHLPELTDLTIGVPLVSEVAGESWWLSLIEVLPASLRRLDMRGSSRHLPDAFVRFLHPPCALLPALEHLACSPTKSILEDQRRARMGLPPLERPPWVPAATQTDTAASFSSVPPREQDKEDDQVDWGQGLF